MSEIETETTELEIIPETKPQAKKPFIVQFEAEDFYRAVAGLILYDLGWGVDKSAHNLRQAEDMIRAIEAKRFTPDLAIIDTLLEREHNEGEQIAARLKAIVPDIKIIAFTIIEEQPWADYTAIQSNRDPNHTLIKGLEQLLGAKPVSK